MQKLWKRPETNRTISPGNGVVSHEKMRLQDIQTSAQTIIVRAVETVYACDHAIELIEQYEPPPRPAVEVTPGAGIGWGCTEAPRGFLYHRYRLDYSGAILDARIVPPTAQNQKVIEDDLRRYVSDHLDTPLVPPKHGDSSGVRGAAWLWSPEEAAQGADT